MRTRKPAEERKSEIVETTLRLADKVGPDRLATGEIAQAVGVTQAALFRHFATKQDLWEAVATRIGEKFQQRWRNSERAAPDPLARLHATVNAQLTLIQSTPAIPAILFSRELHVENRALRVIFAGFMRNFHVRVERMVAAAQRDGRLRTDIDARDAALLVIGLVQGLVMRWSLTGRGFTLPAEGARLLDLQLMSLGAAPAGPDASQHASPARAAAGRSPSAS